MSNNVFCITYHSFLDECLDVLELETRKQVWLCINSNMLSGLLTERVGKQLRVQIGTTTLFSFPLGLLGLPAIAYLSRGSSWRIIYLWTSIPSILYCIIAYFFLYEYSRWLFVQGRDTEAIAVLKSISCIKGRSLD